MQDTQNTIASVAEVLTIFMNVTAVGGRSFAELVSATDTRDPTYVTVKSIKNAPKQTPGLCPVRQANTAK